MCFLASLSVLVLIITGAATYCWNPEDELAIIISAQFSQALLNDLCNPTHISED
jgi:hypothetical protein